MPRFESAISIQMNLLLFNLSSSRGNLFKVLSRGNKHNAETSKNIRYCFTGNVLLVPLWKFAHKKDLEQQELH